MNWKNFACTMTAMVGLILIAVLGCFWLKDKFACWLLILVLLSSFVLAAYVICSVVLHYKEAKTDRIADEQAKENARLVEKKNEEILRLKKEVSDLKSQNAKNQSEELTLLQKKCDTANIKLKVFYEYAVIPWVRQQVADQEYMEKSFEVWKDEFNKFND